MIRISNRPGGVRASIPMEPKTNFPAVLYGIRLWFLNWNFDGAIGNRVCPLVIVVSR